MKKFKKLSIIMLAVIVLLSISTVQAFAVTSTQDGLEVTLTANKDEYSMGENIITTLTVKNISETDINNVSLENIVPEGHTLSDNSEVKKQVKTLNPNEAVTAVVTYVFEDSKDSIDNTNDTSNKTNSTETTATNTSDKTATQATNSTTPNNNNGKSVATGNSINFIIFSVILLFGASVVILCFRKRNKLKNVISVCLCVAILGTTIPIAGINASATKEESSKSISVILSVKYNGNNTDLSALVYYEIDTTNTNKNHTVNFNLNYDGAEPLPAVTVKDGEYVTMPQAPERESCVFTGWYSDENLSEYFYSDTTPINSDITLFAGWINFNDTTDTDGDGIVDSLEEFFHTDKNNVDTDNDGVSDYDEIDCLELDPLKKDTDNNGINDGDEDNDSDGLTNLEEINSGTDPRTADTDLDALNDYDEINVYSTDPLKSDTDGDGVSDGKEIELGTNPLIKEENFSLNVTSKSEDTVKASVEIELSGEQVETLSVEQVNNDLLFNKEMPGYIGSAYDFSVDGSFETATISFEFDSALLESETFNPTIYYFNKEKQALEALPTTVNGNVASAVVNHFSEYILINRTVYEESFTWIDVWDANDYTGVEVVLVIDDSGSMSGNDRINNRLTVAQNLIDNLPENSKIGVVRFSSGTNILTESLTADRALAKSYLTTDYFRSSGGTYMYRAIDSSFSLFEAEDEEILKMMVVLSDGATSDTNMQSSVISYANEQKVKIYTVGLGSNTHYFSSYLDPLSTNTGAKLYLASNADQLTEIYDDISEKIDIETDSDSDGISDYYEDNMVIFNGIKLSLDKNNNDTDGDGLLDGEEIAELNYEYSEDGSKVIVTGRMKSNPTSIDSDNDGLYDNQERIANGKTVAPKDPDSTTPNGPSGIWDAHIFQQTYGKNPEHYSDSPGLGLAVDKSVADVLVRIALLLKDPVNKNEVVLRNIALFIKQFCHGEIAATAGAYLLNFIYDEDYIAYHSQPDTWQRSFGYNEFYDEIFDIGSFMLYEDFDFSADDKEYVLWMWKGDYWNLESGAEIGLYIEHSSELDLDSVLPSDTPHYDVVDFELPMTLSLYNYYSETNIQNIFSWRPETPQWWVTGFNPNFTTPDPEVMISVGSVDFSGHTELYNGLKTASSNKMDTDKKYQDYLIFDEDGHTVWIIWYEGVKI